VYVPAHKPLYGGFVVIVAEVGVISVNVYGAIPFVGLALIDPLQTLLQESEVVVMLGVILGDCAIEKVTAGIGHKEASFKDTV
jgi:hypothetical protein